MRKVAAALVAAVMGVCAQAEAAVYTQSTNLNFGSNDVGYFPYLAFVPNFDRSLGTLVSTTFTLRGVAEEMIQFYQNTPPTSGAFVNTVQFNNSAPIVLSTTQITSNSFLSANTLRDNFPVNASMTYSPSYNGFNSQLDLTISVEGLLQTPACCAYTSVRFGGTLTTDYTYNPVPEPISAALLLTPLAGVIALRRRSQAVTGTA